MAYRDGLADPRVSQLQALLDAEPTWRDELVRVRFAQDELLQEVDRLETEIAERERGGGGVWKRLFGKRGSIDQLRSELAVATEQRTASIAREQEVNEKLAAMTAARADLDELERDAAIRLRAEEGPIGDELRALIEAAAAEVVVIDAAQATLVAIEAAVTSMNEIGESLVALQAAKNTRQRGLVSSVLVDADVVAVRARIASALEFARSQLRGAADACDAMQPRWPAIDKLLSTVTVRALSETPTLRPAELSPLALASAELGNRLETVMSGLLEERRRIEARRDQHVSREREIVAQTVRGS